MTNDSALLLGCEASQLAGLPGRHRVALCAEVLDRVTRRVRTSVSLAAVTLTDATVTAAWAVVGDEIGCGDELDMAVRRWRSVASHTDLPPVLEGIHQIIEALDGCASATNSVTIDLTGVTDPVLRTLANAVDDLFAVGAIDDIDVADIHRIARELVRGNELGLDLDPLLLSIALGSQST